MKLLKHFVGAGEMVQNKHLTGKYMAREFNPRYGVGGGSFVITLYILSDVKVPSKKSSLIQNLNHL